MFLFFVFFCVLVCLPCSWFFFDSINCFEFWYSVLCLWLKVYKKKSCKKKKVCEEERKEFIYKQRWTEKKNSFFLYIGGLFKVWFRVSDIKKKIHKISQKKYPKKKYPKKKLSLFFFLFFHMSIASIWVSLSFCFWFVIFFFLMTELLQTCFANFSFGILHIASCLAIWIVLKSVIHLRT